MDWQPDTSMEPEGFGDRYGLPETLSHNGATRPCEYLEVVAAYVREQTRWLAYMVNGEEMSNWRHEGLDISTYIGEAAEQGWHLITLKVPGHRVPGGSAERRIYVFKRYGP